MLFTFIIPINSYLNFIITLKELIQWEQWEENPVVVVPDKPINPIQEKIEQYRQQACKPTDPSEEEQQPNFFEVNNI